MSFILASPLNTAAYFLFERWANTLRPFETQKRHPDDQPIDPGDAEIAVLGTYNFYAEAGYGFAEHVRNTLGDQGKLCLKGA